MQFDQTGNDKIIFTVNCTGWDMLALANIANNAVLDCYSPFEHPIT
jgi:hypothetical protein